MEKGAPADIQAVNRISVAPVRPRALIVVAVMSNVMGNFALGHGMRLLGETVSFSPLPYIEAFLHPWVAIGVALLCVWIVAQLSLLSRADLSYVLPVTAASYVLTALLGHYLLDERISLTRWFGIGAITVGVAIVGRTAPSTTPTHEPEDPVER